MILKAKFTVENESIPDSTVKSMHAEALATVDRHGPDHMTMSCFFEQNKETCSAVTRASDLSKF